MESKDIGGVCEDAFGQSPGDSQDPLARGRSRLQRQRPPVLRNISNSTDRAPLQPPVAPLTKRQSRNSLIGFFGRPKSIRISQSSGHLSVLAEEQMSISPKEVVGAKVFNRTKPPPSPSTTLLSPASSRSQSSKASRTKSIKSPRSASLDPPPLFQAYPQSVKHSTLVTPTLEPDLILRAHKVSTGASSETGTSEVTEAGLIEKTQKKQEEKARRHRRRMTGSLSKSDWVRRIYVLVTAGFILQYSGEGTFDRLPEKIMRLGKDSVVFVSDAIPGKPYVLQVSQNSNSDGEAVIESSKPLLSRIGIRTADFRRATSSFLLIFETPEEMQSWLVTVRREIESLGGNIRPQSPSRPLPSPTAVEHKLSDRYLVTRDANRLSWVEMSRRQSKTMSSVSSEHDGIENRSPDTCRSNIADRQRYSFAPTEAPSLSTTVTSIDFDESRDSRPLTLVVADMQRHSVHSSPPVSPVASTYDFVLPDLAPFDYPEPPHQTSSKRTCLPSSVAKNVQGSTKGSNEILKANAHVNKSLSPTPPNFSVPTFSQRFSSSTGSASAPPTPPRSTRTSEILGTSRPTSHDGLEFDFRSRPTSVVDEIPSSSTIIAPPLASRGSRLSSEFTIAPTTPAKASPPAIAIRTTDDAYDESFDEPLTVLPNSSRVFVRPKRLSSLVAPQVHLPTPTMQPLVTIPPAIPREPDADGTDRAVLSTGSPTTPAPDPSVPTTTPKRPLSIQPESFRSMLTRDRAATSPTRRRNPGSTMRNRVLSDVGVEGATMSCRLGSRVLPRKSMPDLMAISPPAPPPDCPLPALPPELILPKEQDAFLRARQSLYLPSFASYDVSRSSSPAAALEPAFPIREHSSRAQVSRARFSMG